MGLSLGLDIGSNAVRVALVKTTLRGAQLIGCAESLLDATQEPKRRLDQLRVALTDMVRSLRATPDNVIAGLPGYKASFRVLELPAAVEKRIRDILPHELDSLLPASMEDEVFDYQLIDRVNNRIRIFATAALKQDVAAQLEELRAIGIDPRELAVGAAALDGLGPLVPALQESGPVVVINLQDGVADICFLAKGRCEMARTLTLNTESQPSALSFESSLRQTFAGYRALGGGEPTAVYLGGEGSEQPAMVSWVAQILGREVSVIELPPAQNGQGTFSRFARAAALAARAVAPGKHLNLRQGEFSRQRTVHSIRRHVRLIAICAASVVLSMAFSLYARWSVLNDERTGLEAELAQITKEVFGTEAKTIETAKKMVSGTSHEDPMPRFDGFDVINALSQRIAPEIKHQVRRLIVDINEETHEGRLELEGDVPTINESDTIAQALEAHECLQDVEKKRTSRQADGTVRYQLDAIIQCEDDTGSKPRKQTRSRSSEVE